MAKPPAEAELARLYVELKRLKARRDVHVSITLDGLRALYGDEKLYNGGNGHYRRRFEEAGLIRAAGFQALTFEWVFFWRGTEKQGDGPVPESDPSMLQRDPDAFRLGTIFRARAIIEEMDKRGLEDRLPSTFRDPAVREALKGFDWP